MSSASYASIKSMLSTGSYSAATLVVLIGCICHAFALAPRPQPSGKKLKPRRAASNPEIPSEAAEVSCALEL